MSEPFIGEIVMFGGNFAPRGWALCNGQLLSIAQNTALFSILGTTFGGNGTTTFALPNMQSRVPIHQGQGPGLSNYVLGETGGSESVTLIQTQMPAHNHQTTVTITCADSPQTPIDSPVNAVPAGTSGGATVYASSGAAQMSASMATATVAVAGGSQPHENRQPYLCVNFIIATQGIFPSRN
jgi:microcystin-dependent protein